jgi:hypothetical protein
MVRTTELSLILGKNLLMNPLNTMEATKKRRMHL